MGDISVRKIDDYVLREIRGRAARNGISMEEQVRRILKEAIEPPQKLGDAFYEAFGPENGFDLELPDRGGPHEPIDFSE